MSTASPVRRTPVLVAMSRTGIGRANRGSLANHRSDQLGAQVARAALDAAPEIDLAEVDDLIAGCAMPGGQQGFNLGRVIAVMLGADSVPGATVTRYCASSLQSVQMASHAIRSGDADIMLALGVESVSQYVHGNSNSIPDTKNPLFEAAQESHVSRVNQRLRWEDPRDRGDLPDVYIAMGQTAENVADIKGVSRQEQDEFAVRTQELADQWSTWREQEITGLELSDGSVFATDECVRPGTTVENLGAISPAFREDGTVTAGNACALSDGAAAVLVMEEEEARRRGLQPLARLVSSAVAGVSPEVMGLGVIPAVEKALYRSGLTVKDLAIAEINEAFAAQVVPSYRDLGLSLEQVNPRGGAIALGHPFGMTGIRMIMGVVRGLRQDGERYGLTSMCVGGGQGMAMIWEACE